MMRKRWFCGASRPMLKSHSVPPVCECLRVSGTGSGMGLFWAGVAQLVEHLICNQRVGGSSPFAGSTKHLTVDAGVVEWLMAPGCKPGRLTPYAGSNPAPCTIEISNLRFEIAV